MYNVVKNSRIMVTFHPKHTPWDFRLVGCLPSEFYPGKIQKGKADNRVPL